ncbi:MAG: RnfH family protein [Pseudomonas sp.]|nr:RnfH family protein [Pseudomonas sp.]
MKVSLVRAWPRRFEQVDLELPDGACLGDALARAGWDGDPAVDGHAVFGVRVTRDTVLRDGDRVECLRPLELDPKQARRRRAQARPLKAPTTPR